MFYTTESNSQKNDCSQTNFTKKKPSILDCKRFIRERCAAGYLSRDSIQIPIPSGKDDTEKCGICGKTMAELEKMMVGVYGNDWKKQLKAQYSDTYKTILADYNRNALMEARKNEQLDFQKKFDEFCSSGMKGQMIANNNKKDLKHEIKIFITEPNQVRLVSTPDRHFAVLANENIPAFTKFGPFEGEITDNIRKSSDSYWIFTGDNNNEEIKIDGQSCIKSNWMSRIRKNKKEANCVAYVSGDSIHYVALVNIIKNQEIIVHPDIFRSNNNNGSDDKPGDGQDKPDDESSKSGSLDDDESGGDDDGDDGGDDNDGGKKNDDDESSSSDDDDDNGAPDDQTGKNVDGKKEDDDQITGAGSEATSDQTEVQRPQAADYYAVLPFEGEYIRRRVRKDLENLYKRINTTEVYNKMKLYLNQIWNLYGLYPEPDWVTTFRDHLSTEANQIFQVSKKVGDDLNVDYDEHLNSVVAVSRTQNLLQLKDLYSLWTDSPNAWVNKSCMEYYTKTQIDMFDLRELCGVLPFNFYLDAVSFANKSQNDLLEDEVFGGAVKQMKDKEFVIGGFLFNGHWMSVFVRRGEEGIIHVTNPMENNPIRWKGTNYVERVNVEGPDFKIDTRSNAPVYDKKTKKIIKPGDKWYGKLDQLALLVLQQFFHKVGWGVRSVTFNKMLRIAQTDFFNCGVFTMEYNELIMRQIRIYQNNLDEFELPFRLELNMTAMTCGVYRWKIAETMLLKSLRSKKRHCGRHWTSNDKHINAASLIKPSPGKIQKIMLKDGRIVECGTCDTAYHEGCAKKVVIEEGACVCGSEINLADAKPYTVNEDQEKTDPESPKGLKTPPKQESRTPQKKTPKSNTQVGDNNAKPTPKKRRMSNSSQQVGSAGKKQKTDEKSSSSSKKTPKTGSPKSPEPKKKSDQVGRKSKNAKKKLIFENNEQKK